MTKIAISGFGRIGRIVTRQLFSNPELRKSIQLVAINDLAVTEDLAFCLKYDSTHGKFPLPVSHTEDSITLGDQTVKVLKQANPAELPWKALGVDIVFECTGFFTDKEKASLHLKAGAKKVIVSAPGKGVDGTFVMGVNHDKYDPKNHHIVSNASCTTNCLAPMAYVIHQKFGIVQGLMTTIHSYTSDQRLLDNVHRDPRRARTAAVNMIPTTTGAAKAVGEVIPDLKGKLDGMSVRVPTPNVSFTDLVAQLKTDVTKEDINSALEAAAKEGPLKGILNTTREPLVSSDFNGDQYSSTVDLDVTNVIGGKGNLVKVCSWYDNETGFSCRMLDLAKHMAERGL